MKISFDEYKKLIESYQVEEITLEDGETILQIKSDSGEIIHISPYDNLLPIYALTERYETLNNMVITGELDESEYENFKVLAEYGVLSEQCMEPKPSTKYLYICDNFVDEETFTEQITKHCELYREDNFSYPDKVYISSLNSMEEFHALSDTLDRLTNGKTSLMYYNKIQEIAEQVEQEEILIKEDLADKAIVYLDSSIPEVALLTGNELSLVRCYEAMERFNRYVIEECKKNNTNLVSLKLSSEERNDRVLACLASLFLGEHNIKLIANSLHSGRCNSFVRQFVKMDWNLLEHRYDLAQRRGFKIYTQHSQKYVCYVNKFYYNLEFKSIRYTDFKAYMEKGCEENFVVEKFEALYESKKLKVVPLADVLGFRDLTLDPATTTLEQLGKLRNDTYELEKNIMLPLIKLLERQFKDFKNIYTLRDIMVVGDSKDPSTWLIGVGRMNPCADIIKFVIGESGVQDSSEVVEKVPVEFIQDLDLVIEDLADTEFFERVCKVFAKKVNKVYDEEFLNLCKTKIEKIPRGDALFLNYNLYHTIMTTAEDDVNFLGHSVIYTNLANRTCWSHYEFIRDSLLKYCSLYGIRNTEYERMLVNVYGDLVMSNISQKGYKSAKLKLSDMVSRIF